VNVNAIAPGVFRTDLNTALLDGPRGREFLVRTPMQRFGKLEELIGAARVPVVRCLHVRHRPGHRRRRRIPRQRSQPMNPVIAISDQDNVATALEALRARPCPRNCRPAGHGRRTDSARS
jgi:hypothetical protein